MSPSRIHAWTRTPSPSNTESLESSELSDATEEVCNYTCNPDQNLGMTRIEKLPSVWIRLMDLPYPPELKPSGKHRYGFDLSE
jgi:hypothetical protein